MGALERMRVTWTGFAGAPGYSTFYALEAEQHVGPLRTFFNTIASWIPSGVQIQVPGTGDIITDTDGSVSGAWSTTQPLVVNGLATGNYAAGSGAVVLWTGTGIIDGRRPIGKTFLVPLGNSAFQSDGSLGSSALVDIGNAATALIAAVGASPYIWHRPKYEKDAQGNPVLVRNGGSVQINSARVPDLAAVMRSRRR